VIARNSWDISNSILSRSLVLNSAELAHFFTTTFIDGLFRDFPWRRTAASLAHLEAETARAAATQGFAHLIRTLPVHLQKPGFDFSAALQPQAVHKAVVAHSSILVLSDFVAVQLDVFLLKTAARFCAICNECIGRGIILCLDWATAGATARLENLTIGNRLGDMYFSVEDESGGCIEYGLVVSCNVLARRGAGRNRHDGHGDEDVAAL